MKKLALSISACLMALPVLAQADTYMTCPSVSQVKNYVVANRESLNGRVEIPDTTLNGLTWEVNIFTHYVDYDTAGDALASNQLIFGSGSQFSSYMGGATLYLKGGHPIRCSYYVDAKDADNKPYQVALHLTRWEQQGRPYSGSWKTVQDFSYKCSDSPSTCKFTVK